MKVMERVLEDIIRERVNIDEMQIGFMPGTGTTTAIFIVRQLQDMYLGMKRELYFVFVDLEKMFDRVPRAVLQLVMRKMRVGWVRVVMLMYKSASTQVRISGDFSDEFSGNFGVHLGSVLSSLLFIMEIEALSKDFYFKTGLSWELLSADDLVLVAESQTAAMKRFLRWKVGMGSKV